MPHRPVLPRGSSASVSPVRRGLFGVASVLVAACTSAGASPSGAPSLPGGAAGVPGFDTRVYPGDSVMAVWLEESPYRWVGYYLPAPCFTGTSWQGRRETLGRMGWGTAVLFVGEQDWSAAAGPPADSVPARCTRANLNAERGRTDGQDAARAAAAEGFPRGTVVYLDVERVDSVSAALGAYVAAWAGALLEDGRYEPGLYAHGRNAAELRASMANAFRGAGREGAPALWVASAGGFDLALPPSTSGFDDARVWQGAFDVDERWGGATLRVDRNVADRASPSAP